MEALIKKYEEGKTHKALLLSQTEQKLQLIQELTEHVHVVERAQAFVQATAEETQEAVKMNLEDIVNSAIFTILGTHTFTFHILFDKRRGKIECDLVLVKDGNTNRPMKPLASNGGGLADIVAFGLRVALMILSPSDRVVLVDEPFRFLSKDHKVQCGAWLRQLAEKHNIQIIMVTHEEELIDSAHRVFLVTQDDNTHSEVTTT